MPYNGVSFTVKEIKPGEVVVVVKIINDITCVEYDPRQLLEGETLTVHTGLGLPNRVMISGGRYNG